MVQHGFRYRLRHLPQRVAVGKARLGVVVGWVIWPGIFNLRVKKRLVLLFGRVI
jgi:hypothetical protein